MCVLNTMSNMVSVLAALNKYIHVKYIFSYFYIRQPYFKHFWFSHVCPVENSLLFYLSRNNKWMFNTHLNPTRGAGNLWVFLRAGSLRSSMRQTCQMNVNQEDWTALISSSGPELWQTISIRSKRQEFGSLYQVNLCHAVQSRQTIAN